jgi:hypothetical protein
MFTPHNTLAIHPLPSGHTSGFGNSNLLRKYFNLALENPRKDCRRPDGKPLDTLTSLICESKPNINVYPKFWFTGTLKTRDLTESGMTVKFGNSAGKSPRITRCDGDANVKIESEAHPSKHAD